MSILNLSIWFGFISMILLVQLPGSCSSMFISTPWLLFLILISCGKTSNILGVPYFMDVIMKTSKIRALNVSIGRSTVDSRDLLCRRRRRKLSHFGNSVQDRFNGGGDLHIRELDGTPIFPSSTIVFGKKERNK